MDPRELTEVLKAGSAGMDLGLGRTLSARAIGAASDFAVPRIGPAPAA